MRELTEKGISFEELASASGRPDADPFDLLCHLAWNAPLLARGERARKARRMLAGVEGGPFERYGETAREILSALVDRYVERGIIQFGSPTELLKVQPFPGYGKPTEIADRHFGGVTALREALAGLQAALYQ